MNRWKQRPTARNTDRPNYLASYQTRGDPRRPHPTARTRLDPALPPGIADTLEIWRLKAGKVQLTSEEAFV